VYKTIAETSIYIYIYIYILKDYCTYIHILIEKTFGHVCKQRTTATVAFDNEIQTNMEYDKHFDMYDDKLFIYNLWN
jgi:hypothetical protein